MPSGGTVRSQGGPVTELRSLMLEEIQRRNFTESTRRAYLRIIEDFALYFNRAPDQLGPEQIREYIAHLFRDKKLSDNSVNQTVGALRFGAESFSPHDPDHSLRYRRAARGVGTSEDPGGNLTPPGKLFPPFQGPSHLPRN